MRRSHLRLSLFLYLLSMALPLETMESPFYVSEYFPGIAALIGGLFSLAMIPDEPFIPIAWASNLLLVIGYIRGLGMRRRSPILASFTLAMILPLILVDTKEIFPHFYESPAFLVWFAAILLFFVTEVFDREKKIQPYKNQMRINGHPRDLFFQKDLEKIRQKLAKKGELELTVQGIMGNRIQVNFNPEFAVATYYPTKEATGKVTYYNLENPPGKQTIVTTRYGHRDFNGEYMIDHSQAFGILEYFARTGRLVDGVKWSDELPHRQPPTYDYTQLPT